jgi:hypothetical protein
VARRHRNRKRSSAIGARESTTTADGGLTGTHTPYTYAPLNPLDTLINTKPADSTILPFYDYTAALEIRRTPPISPISTTRSAASPRNPVPRMKSMGQLGRSGSLLIGSFARITSA